MKIFNFYTFSRKKIIFLFLLLTSIHVFAARDTVEADKFSHYADSLYYMGLYNESITHYFKAAEIYKENNNWKKFILSLKDIGFIYGTQGYFEKSFSFLDSALNIASQLFGKESMVIGLLYNAYGTSYSELGNYDKSLFFYDKNLNITLKHFKPDDYTVATVYNNIGVVYFNKGDYYEALKYYERAHYASKKICGETYDYLAYSYNNIASVYHALLDYEHALQIYETALNITSTAIEKTNRVTASIINNIGVIYFEKHEFEESLKFNKSAIKIKLSLYGNHHHFIGNSYFNLGNIYSQETFLGYNTDRARYYYLKTLKIYQNNFGQIHPDIANTYLQLAILEKELKNYQQAMNYHSETEKILCGTILDNRYENNKYLNTTISDLFLLNNLDEKAELYFQMYVNQTNK